MEAAASTASEQSRNSDSQEPRVGELGSSSEEDEGLKDPFKWILCFIRVDALTCPSYSWMSMS